jgi:hypothetical protein
MKNPDFCLGFFFCPSYFLLCKSRADRIGFTYFSAVKFKPTLLTALLLFSSLNVQPAHAGCAPTSSSAFASDSSISNNQVLVCASATQQKTTSSTSSINSKTVSKTVSKVPPQANCPGSVTTTAQIVAATLAGCKIAGPVLPPAPPPKPVATLKVAEKVSSKSSTTKSLAAQSDQALFSVQPLKIQPSTELAQTGESVILTTNALEHESTASILGRIGYVRFVPVAYSWSIDSAGDSPVAVASYSASGTKSISRRVTYRASSRFSLSEPWQPVGQVFANAETQLEIVEPAKQPSPAATARARAKPRLVFASCETKPSTYRC